MPKSEFLQIRLTPEERLRVQRAAAEEHLSPSTWARQLLLKLLDDRERQTSPDDESPRT